MIDVCFEVMQTCVIYCTVIFILKLLNVILTLVHECCCYFIVSVKCIFFSIPCLDYPGSVIGEQPELTAETLVSMRSIWKDTAL